MILTALFKSYREMRMSALVASIMARLKSKGNKMSKGTVKWFNTTKGFGFIQPQNGSNDVFVHITALQSAGISNLDEGQLVSYEIETNRGKESAVNLQILQAA